MSLSSRSAVRMDLAAFRLDEVEEISPGSFRHKESMAARFERWFSRPAIATESEAALPDEPYAWHSIADLIAKARAG